MSDPINLRISGQFTQPLGTGVEQADKPVNRFDLLKAGGDEGVGITGAMKSGAVKVEVGEGQNAPDTHGTGKSRGNAVKDFFQSIGQGIKSIFQKAVDGLSRLSENFRLRNDDAIPFNAQGKEIAKAAKANDPDAMATVVRGIAKTFLEEAGNADRSGGRSLDEILDRSFSLAGSDGVSLLPEDVAPMKAMVPALRAELGNFPTAMKILDRIESFDFHAELKATLNKELDNLRNVDFDSGVNSGMGTFLRGNSFFSAAMKEHQNKFFDPKSFGADMMSKHFDRLQGVADAAKHLNETGGEQITRLDAVSIKKPVVGEMLVAVRNMMDDLVKVDDPGGMKERFGDTHLALLKSAADEIAAQTDILPELRNEALFKLYNNDLFLRGVVPALVMDPGGQKIEMNAGRLASSMIQFVLNNADGGSKMSADLKEGYLPLRDEYQTKLTEAFVALGMPVVPTN